MIYGFFCVYEKYEKIVDTTCMILVNWTCISTNDNIVLRANSVFVVGDNFGLWYKNQCGLWYKNQCIIHLRNSVTFVKSQVLFLFSDDESKVHIVVDA